MPRRQLVHTGENGSRLRHVADRQVVHDGIRVERTGELRERDERAQLGRERDSVTSRPIVERLDAETIAGDEQAPPPIVPDGEAEHPAQLPRQPCAVVLVQVDEGLGIAGSR